MRLFLAACLPIVTFVLFAPFAMRGIDVHHDGFMLKPALDVWSGQTPFTQTFNQYGSLNSYLQAVFLATFGPTLLSLKLATAALYGASLLLLFWIWQSFLPTGLALLGVVLFWAMAPFYRIDWPLLPWSSSHALFFQSVTSVLLVSSVHADTTRRSTWLAALAGVSTGLVVWCRMPVGVLLFVAVAFTLGWLRALPRLRAFVSAFAATNVAFLLDLVLRGALAAWYDEVIEHPRRWLAHEGWTNSGSIFESLFPSYTSGLGFALWLFGAIALHRGLTRTPAFAGKRWISIALAGAWVFVVFRLGFLAILSADPESGWVSVMPVALALTGLFLLARSLREDARVNAELQVLLLLCAICVASWAQYYPVTCYRHVFWSAAPMIGPFLWLVHRAFDARTLRSAGVLLVLCAPLLADRVLVAANNLVAPYYALEKPAVLRGMLATEAQARNIVPLAEVLDAYFGAHGVRPILFDGFNPLYGTFTSDLRNPGPYTVGTNYEDAQTEPTRVRFVKELQPVIVVEALPGQGTARAARFHVLGYETLTRVARFEILVPRDTLR